jgi:hypothetical protein
MAQYYYAVSTLPFLSYEGEPRISSTEFLELCASRLTEEDRQAVRSASLLPPDRPAASDFAARNEVLRRWYRFERGLRNELARVRAGSDEDRLAKALRADEEGNSNAQQLDVDRVVREVINQDNPLTAEDLLDRARWAYLNELEIGHFFDVGKLIIYYLKLQILERRARFTKERGTEMYEKSYEALREDMDLEARIEEATENR